MPRKSTKRTKKRQKVSNVLVSVQKMEMELLKVPAKMAATLGKEINANKKQEAKLNKAMNKLNKQIHKIEAQISSAENAKNAKAGKKKLKVATKMYNKAADSQALVNKQLVSVANTLQGLLSQQDKFAALEKALKQFNSEWSKTSKKKKSKSGAMNKSNLHAIEETADTTLDEITELAS